MVQKASCCDLCHSVLPMWKFFNLKGSKTGKTEFLEMAYSKYLNKHIRLFFLLNSLKYTHVFKAKIITLSGEVSNVCRYNSYDNYNVRNSRRELKGPIWLQIFCILQ